MAFHLFIYSFSLSLLISFCFFPSAHPLSTFSISENPNSNQTLICALGLHSSSLRCSGFPAGIQISANQNVSFSGIVSGEGFVCGLTTFASLSTSNVVCWRFSGNNFSDIYYKRIYRGPPITQFEAGNSHICGLVNGTNRLECWQWPDFSSNLAPNFSGVAVGEDFVCGLLESGRVSCLGNNTNVTENVPPGNFSWVAAGFGHACAINLSGDLDCWGDTAAAPPQGKFSAVALGENRSCGLRVNGTVVCWGEGNFGLPEELERSAFISIEGKRRVFCGVLQFNYSLVCWGNSNLSSNSVVFPEVLPGPCTSQCRCAALAGSGNYCSGGGFICPPCGLGSPAPPLPSSPLPESVTSPSSSWNGGMTAFLVVGCVGSASLLLAAGFFLFRYCKFRGCRVHDSGRLDEIGSTAAEGGSSSSQQQPEPPVLEKRLSQLTSFGPTTHLEEFHLQSLLEATNNFSEDHKIGAGSFGSVYRATLENGRLVAVKRAESSNTCSYAWDTKRQAAKDNAFINELESLSRLHHKNLVRLLGFCEDCNERVLVYEFMTNGNLHDHLHRLNDSPLMAWAARIKVALDAARGIQYLHEYAVPSIIHRDIKSSNILLDSTWTAKVSDFGLSLMCPSEDESHLSLHAAGTVGYIDPEYYRLQQLTKKSDVYSFGVVLLELLSGYKAIHKNEHGVPRNVVDFVAPYIVQDEIHRVLDPGVPPPTPFEIEAVKYVGYLAMDCVRLEGRDRPSMTEIVNRLERALAACLAPPTLSRSTTDSST